MIASRRMASTIPGPGRGQDAWARNRALLPWAWTLLVGLTAGGRVQAASPAPVAVTEIRSPPPTRPGLRGRKGKTKAHPSRPPASWLFQKPVNVVPNQQGKVVVFGFRNDDRDAVSAQVGRLLELRGMEVVTGVRPVDNAEQFRDVATHLGLVAFIAGDVRGNDARTLVTVRLRSGFTGRPLSTATFTDSRENLPRNISDTLWKKVGAVMARACLDAGKPRKPSRALRINAGTPIETVPAHSER